MKILKRLEVLFSAAAFAEAGEHDTAREIMKEEGGPPSKAKERVPEARKRPVFGEDEELTAEPWKV